MVYYCHLYLGTVKSFCLLQSKRLQQRPTKIIKMGPLKGFTVLENRLEMKGREVETKAA